MTTAEMEATQVLIDPRFCGPNGVGNGGYVSGIMASRFQGDAEVTLRRPPPVDRQLTLEWYEHVLLLCDGPETVAAAEAVELELPVPAPPSYQEAVHATRFRMNIDDHPFPNCFVCGPGRAEGDALRLQIGPLEARSVVAAPWIPSRDLADGAGLVRDEFVCASLDCPGAFAAGLHVPAVLGRFAVSRERPVLAGERYAIIGWERSHDGRKHEVGTALFSADGMRHASARATWIELRTNTG